MKGFVYNYIGENNWVRRDYFASAGLGVLAESAF
jgi:hypothetical protein